eukprot:1154279-Pelagomonas_calceolata.AAC.6
MSFWSTARCISVTCEPHPSGHGNITWIVSMWQWQHHDTGRQEAYSTEASLHAKAAPDRLAHRAQHLQLSSTSMKGITLDSLLKTIPFEAVSGRK